MTMDRTGCTRVVFLMGRWAFKVPNFFDWRLFLKGLLANMQERAFSEALRTGWRDEALLPVSWSLPGGFLVVMPRVRILTDEEYTSETIPDIPWVEKKYMSWGWYHGKIVAIDYGS